VPLYLDSRVKAWETQPLAGLEIVARVAVVGLEIVARVAVTLTRYSRVKRETQHLVGLEVSLEVVLEMVVGAGMEVVVVVGAGMDVSFLRGTCQER
jgi:hypothetical protein